METNINYKLYTLNETISYDRRSVFNFFFLSNTKIIYVINDKNILIGIITIKKFLECFQDENSDHINRDFLTLQEDKTDILLSKAQSMAEQYAITSAIPVVDGEGKLLYEIICCAQKKKKKNPWLDFYNKFDKYIRCSNLYDELIFLRKVLIEQNITVIGTPIDFDTIFGTIFLDKTNILFLDEEITDGYQLLSSHTDLLIDLTTENHVGRIDIYKICNNGYSWDGFWEHILFCLEHDYFNMICSAMIENGSFFKQYLNKYFKEICIQTNNLLAYWIKNWLYENFRDIEIQLGLFRRETFKSHIILNGEVGKVNWGSIAGFCQQISFAVQWSEIYRRMNKKVKFVNLKCESPLFLSEGERARFQDETTAEKFFVEIENGKIVNGICDLKRKSIPYFKNVPYGISIRQRRRFENDFNLYDDYNGDLVHIENGIRNTCGQPAQYHGTIYIVGVCTVFGWYVEDKYTIPSIIQDEINLAQKRYRVVNLGSTIPINYEKLVEKLEIFSEDLFVVLYPAVIDELTKEIPIVEIGDMLTAIRKEKYPKKDIFLDLPSWHCSDYGNRLYAEVIIDKIYKFITHKSVNKVYRNNIFELFKRDYRDLNVLYDFQNYFLEVEKIKSEIPKTALKIGCIVMNCNPFTLGHKYLINVARQQVDHLIIFVVEEDKSEVLFRDRIEMVRRGVLGMDDVSVIRSGKLIISGATFAEYFVKSHIGQDQEIHFSMVYDLNVFARYIAPELDIQYRFVGEEPLDRITAQYNRDMKRVLSSFGINVIEIGRKRMDNGEFISASKVRDALAHGNMGLAKKMLPLTTIDYMINEIGLQ